MRGRRVHRLRVRRAVGNVALVGAVCAVVAGYVAVQKTVMLVVNGRPEPVRTMSHDVGELLDAQGIVVGLGDLVSPPEPTPLADGMTVLVDHDVRDWTTTPAGGVGVWVMEGASEPSSSARHAEDWFSAGVPGGQPTMVAVRVVVMGKDHDVITNATKAGELLSAMGIEPDRNDRVLPSPSAPLEPGTRVRYVSIDYRIREYRLLIPHTTYTTYSGRLRPGDVRLIRPGADGLMLERYRLRIVDGEVAGRALLDRRVLVEAVAGRRVMGRVNSIRGTQVGEASWYSFAPGSGLTAAHPTLPFGTVVTVTNLANGNRVRVVINDRGPFGGRIIDLSDEAFARIAPLSQGVCEVRLTG
jgi:uncharacterized protein YabE (DUF348 family)